MENLESQKVISFKYAQTYSRIGIEYKISSDME